MAYNLTKPKQRHGDALNKAHSKAYPWTSDFCTSSTLESPGCVRFPSSQEMGGQFTCSNSLLLVVFPVLGHILSQWVVRIRCAQQGLYAAHTQRQYDQSPNMYTIGVL